MYIERMRWRMNEANQRNAWAKVLLCAGILICIQFFGNEAHASQYRAFYYDASGLLIQIEEVPDAALEGRILLNVDEALLPIPMLTKRVAPLLIGTKIPMSRLATIAVYYTYDTSGETPEDGSENVRAFPDKIEYLGTVNERVLENCVDRSSTDPCLYPRRCHCGYGSCCCY